MAWVNFDFASTSARPLPDAPHRVTVKQRFHATQPWTHVKQFDREQWAGRYNARAHHLYQFRFTISGFQSFIERFKAPPTETTRRIRMQSRITTLPTHNDLSNLQKKLLRSFDRPATEVWSEFSDNQCATFFHVTYAFDKYMLTNGDTLASCLRGLLRVGGSEITCPAPKKMQRHRTVKGWRLHVEFRRDLGSIPDLLQNNGFRTGKWPVHRTHTDCGYTTSYRADLVTDIGLQVCLSNQRPLEADIDVDIGWRHRSAPWHVCPKLQQTYNDVEGKYDVT